MAIRPESRWWIVTLVLVGGLFGLSALALDRPNVVWSAAGVAACPSCGSEARPGTRRCAACREEYDWVVAPQDVAPASPFALSPLEAAWVEERVTALGEAAAAGRVAAALELPLAAAQAWLGALDTGTCGWCGGTGLEPAAAAQASGAPSTVASTAPGTGPSAASSTAANPVEVPCSTCRGRKRCISCDRGHKVRLGDPEASAAYARLQAALADFRPVVTLEVQRAEVERLNAEFLERHAGAPEAQLLVLPAQWAGLGRSLPEQRLVVRARGRIDRALEALGRP
ncbi:MAG: hypothetical protein ACKOSS_02125 [Planctomycetia bacterium]